MKSVAIMKGNRRPSLYLFFVLVCLFGANAFPEKGSWTLLADPGVQYVSVHKSLHVGSKIMVKSNYHILTSLFCN